MRNLLVILFILIVTPILFVRLNRPLRQPVEKQIDVGTRYERFVFSGPNIVAHVVEIDLNQTQATFKVTSTDEADQFEPLKTTSFLNQFGSQIAINGSFYQVNRQSGAFQPIGMVISDGVVENNGRSRYPALCISNSNQIGIEAAGICPEGTAQGIAGNVLVVNNGNAINARNSRFPGRANAFRPEPRTAVGLSEDGRTMWLVVVDGRQPSYSVGMTMDELGEFMAGLGVETAVNLDGGGSSTLVTQNWYGRATTLNSPVHNGIPTLQRPVPTHLGVTLDKIDTVDQVNSN
ncbi:MAG: phosphodiester glycosidase family protein [Chloroflexota bacterium]